MKDVNVIVYGVGSVGSGIVNTLRSRKGVKLVGAVDIDPEKIGKDVGIVAGGEPIGVIVTDDARELVQTVKADVALNTAAPLGIRETYQDMLWAIENGVNVIVASMETCNLWFTDAELAKEVDTVCKRHGATYMGIGATQVEERYITCMTEGCTDVQHISFTHHADCQAFTDESNAAEWGLTLTKEEFTRRVAEGTVKSKEELKSIVPYVANTFGWELDDVKMVKELQTDANGRINSIKATVEGFIGGVSKIDMNWEMVIEPERRYFDHLVVKGTPMIDAMNNYTPDRGMAATIGSITNCIACIAKLPTGYVNTLTAPACHIIYDEYGKHI